MEWSRSHETVHQNECNIWGNETWIWNKRLKLVLDTRWFNLDDWYLVSGTVCDDWNGKRAAIEMRISGQCERWTDSHGIYPGTMWGWKRDWEPGNAVLTLEDGSDRGKESFLCEQLTTERRYQIEAKMRIYFRQPWEMSIHPDLADWKSLTVKRPRKRDGRASESEIRGDVNRSGYSLAKRRTCRSLSGTRFGVPSRRRFNSSRRFSFPRELIYKYQGMRLEKKITGWRVRTPWFRELCGLVVVYFVDGLEASNFFGWLINDW
jgi:hypothetical protein